MGLMLRKDFATSNLDVLYSWDTPQLSWSQPVFLTGKHRSYYPLEKSCNLRTYGLYFRDLSHKVLHRHLLPHQYFWQVQQHQSAFSEIEKM